VLNLLEVFVRPVGASEAQRFQRLVQQHHYLGALPKIGESLRYVASWRDQWVVLLSFSAAALKCTARNRWIGWDFRHQFDRLKLLTNNSRFLILPDWHFPNLASRILSLCQKRLAADWQSAFGHLVVLLETFGGPPTVPGHHLQSGQLVICGRHRGLPSDAQGLQCHGRLSEDGFCQTIKVRCANPVIPAYS
jgi:hypothetical protein